MEKRKKKQVKTKQEGEQASGFLPSDRYFSFFWVVISVCMLHFSSWANVYQILINYFLFLLKFGSTTSVYHGKTFKQHFFFSISQQLLSVKNKLLECFMETSQFISQFVQCVRRLWLFRTSFLGKTGLGVRWLV